MRAGGMMAVAAVAALTTVTFGTAHAAPPDTPFVGTWTGVDDVGPDPDLSNVVLTIGSGPAPVVVLDDDGASVCGGDPLTPGTFRGRGHYNKRTGVLTVNFTRNTCDNGTRPGVFTGIGYVFLDADTIQGGGATLDATP